MKRPNKMKAILCLMALGATFAFVGCKEDAPKDISVEEYTITFSTGSGAGKTQEAYKGEKINQPDSPTKEGYYFRGWYKGNADGTQIEEAPFDFTQTTVSGDVYLYAKWEKIPAFGAEVTDLTVTDGEDGASIVLSTTAEGVEYSIDGITWQDSGTFAVESGTLYVCSVRAKATETTDAGGVFTKRIVTKPQASDFTLEYPQGEFEKVIVHAAKEEVDYEYSLDGQRYTTSNVFEGLSAYEDTQTLYVRVAGDGYALPPSRALEIEAEIRHNPDKDNKDRLRKGWVLEGSSVEITTSTAAIGLNGVESTNSIQLACDPLDLTGACVANIYFNRPTSAHTVAFDVYVVPVDADAKCTLLGNSNAENYDTWPLANNAWTRIALKPDNGGDPILQLRFEGAVTIYVDNLEAITATEYEELMLGYADGVGYVEGDALATVTGVSGDYEYEYRVNGGAYSESPSFAAAIGNEYIVSVRRKSTAVTYPDKTIKVSFSESSKIKSAGTDIATYGFTVEETSAAEAIATGADDNFAAKITLTKTETSSYINLLVRAIDKAGVKFQMKVVDAANPATAITSMAIKTNQDSTNMDLPTPTAGEWTEVKLLPWTGRDCLLQFTQLSQSVIIYIDEITPITMEEYLGGAPVTMTQANSTALNSLGDAHELKTGLTFGSSFTIISSIGYGHNRGISVNLGGVDVSEYESLDFTLKFTRVQKSGASLDYYVGKAMTNEEFVAGGALASFASFTKIGTYDDTLATDAEVQVSVKISTLQALGVDVHHCAGFSFAYNDNTAPTAVSVTAATLSKVKFVK